MFDAGLELPVGRFGSEVDHGRILLCILFF